MKTTVASCILPDVEGGVPPPGNNGRENPSSFSALPKLLQCHHVNTGRPFTIVTGA
jgi:hypothetical protein